MVEPVWIFLGLLVGDFIIAWIIRKSGLQRAFEVISIISFILPIMYSVTEWNIGVQNGTYTVNDLDDRIIWLFLYSLGFAFSGGIIGYFVGGRNDKL